MRMRPSLRCVARMNSPPRCDLILGSNSGPGKAGLARAARAPAVAVAPRPAARPRHIQQLARQRVGELALRRVVNGINPFDLRLAELARAIALIKGVEHAALARRSILDIRIARERRDSDAVAARRVN